MIAVFFSVKPTVRPLVIAQVLKIGKLLRKYILCTFEYMSVFCSFLSIFLAVLWNGAVRLKIPKYYFLI